MFNDGRYWEQMQAGVLKAVVLEERPAPKGANQPPGTRSQMISYHDSEDNEIARVHQYLKADGTLGASGKPDPKRLLINDTLFRLVKAKDRQ